MTEFIDISLKQSESDSEQLNDINPISSFKNKVQNYWQILIKITELITCITCVSLLMEPLRKDDFAKVHLDHFVVILTTGNGYILITIIFLLAKIIGDTIPNKTTLLFAFIASCLFFVSGILLTMDQKKYYFVDGAFFERRPNLLNMVTGASVLCFFAAALFSMDVFFIRRYKKKF